MSERAVAVTTVLFACIHNAGRSQMAAAFFNLMADPEKAAAISAGTQPAGQVHPEVVATMRELDIDLTAVRPRLLTPALGRTAQLLVTMGCGDECPFIVGVEREDWRFSKTDSCVGVNNGAIFTSSDP